MLTPEQQAADENTPLDRLRELAASSDPVVLQNLAMNPNTPASVISELAKQFPRHVFKNPAIDLLLLEDPNLLTNSANTLLCGLVKRSIAPLPLLKYAANSSDERLQLAATMNAEMPKSALERLAQSQSPRVAGAAQMHVNWVNQEDADWEAIAEAAVAHTCDPTVQSSDVSFAQAMMQLSSIRDLDAEVPEMLMRWVRAKQAHTYPISEAELEQLVQANNWQNLARVASNRHTPAHLLEKIAESAGKSMLSIIAGNPNTPVHLLERCVATGDFDVYTAVARNSSTPPYLLEKLIERRSHRVVSEAVAYNPNTPVHVLERQIDLAETPSTPYWEDVLRAVAQSSRLSPAAFEKLSNYPNPRVRTTVANNPHAPRSLVMRLLEEFEREGGYCLTGYVGFEEIIVTNPHLSTRFLNKLLSESIAGSKNSPYEQTREHYQYAVSVIAAHPNLHPDQLRYLLLDYKDPNIRGAAAKNPNAAKYLVEDWGLSVLDTMPSSIVEIIAQNLDVPDCFFQALLERQKASVQTKAIRNPCISDRVLEQWEASKYYIPGELERALTSEQLLYNTWETRVPASSRLIILLNHRSPSGLLAKLARSVTWLERYAIAKHPNTPNRIRQQLTQDANHAVRAAAIAHSQ